jgi:hypothetical protein
MACAHRGRDRQGELRFKPARLMTQKSFQFILEDG